MSTREAVLSLLAPLLPRLRRLDLRDGFATEWLNLELPLGSPAMQQLRRTLRAAVLAGTVCDREANGVRYSRLLKPDASGVSIDAVHLSGPGPGHTHGRGEIDLSFAVSGGPFFDGRPEGWAVYRPGTWHIPTVRGGVMDILYVLPDGAIRFEDQPRAAAGVGLQRAQAARA
jgi:hypothetical protein